RTSLSLLSPVGSQRTIYCPSPSLIGENCRFRSIGYCWGFLAVPVGMVGHCNGGTEGAATAGGCWVCHPVRVIGPREAYSSFACLLPDRRVITTNIMMVTPKSQRLGRP